MNHFYTMYGCITSSAPPQGNYELCIMNYEFKRYSATPFS